ncbi:unnamed protein product [Ilex paraguariensis]|uniref:Uncharacterized protein n=1 Tax=Ilex paraguariensis TaxID=185542 RepID=A0ABC8V1A8_9AQUA
MPIAQTAPVVLWVTPIRATMAQVTPYVDWAPGNTRHSPGDASWCSGFDANKVLGTLGYAGGDSSMGERRGGGASGPGGSLGGNDALVQGSGAKE